MKAVAHILSSLALGGQERVAYDLAVSQHRAGWNVVVISLAPPPDGPLAAELQRAGVRVQRVARGRDGIDPMLVARLSRWLRKHRIDLVHTHNRMALIYGAPAARLAGAAVVHTKHGYNPRRGTRLLAGNLSGKLVAAFVAVSDETAAVARERKEIAEARLHVIANGIELGQFHANPEARIRIRAELGIEPDACVIGSVGRVAKEKNHALLLRAAAPLLNANTHVVVVGDGPLMDALRDQANGISHVHLTGMRSDVPDVLNAFDIFAMSSDTEGMPLVVLEAMATGLPVVSTNVGGIPNVVEDSVTGFLVPAGDESALRDRLKRLVDDREMRRGFGKRAEQVATERYAATRMQREYLELYDRVLVDRRPRSFAAQS